MSTLPKNASGIIESYTNFTLGTAVCKIPYFNNKTLRSRMALRARIGKGSTKDITDELRTILVKQHVAIETLTNEGLRKILVDNNLGIDCSGFAYYLLNALSEASGQGKMNEHLKLLVGMNPLSIMRARLRPVENCSVRTLASDTNSRTVELKDVKPGDMITLLVDTGSKNYDHVLIIHEVQGSPDEPRAIFYTHAIAYPTDNMNESGVRKGKIEILNAKEPLDKQLWSEDGSVEKARIIFDRIQEAKTEIRRLKWLS